MLRLTTLAILLLPTTPQPGSDEAAAAPILEAVLRAELPSGIDMPQTQRPCVVTAIGAAALDGMRRYRQRRAGRPDGAIPGGAWEVWPRRDGRGIQLLPEREAQALDSVEAQILQHPQPRRAVRDVRPEWLPNSYRLCSAGRRTRRVEVSAPAMIGDVAFVEVEFACPLCGHGVRYALRRTGREWKVVALSTAWVS